VNIIATKLAEKSTWTGLIQAVLGAGVLYAGQSLCGAQPGVDLSTVTLGQIAGHLGMTDVLGTLALLVGGYDIVRKEGSNAAR
jgi:hypothetical protein